jgi:hypothetical protein
MTGRRHDKSPEGNFQSPPFQLTEIQSFICVAHINVSGIPMIACKPLTSKTRGFRPALKTNALRLCIILPDHPIIPWKFFSTIILGTFVRICLNPPSSPGEIRFASMHNSQMLSAKSSDELACHTGADGPVDETKQWIPTSGREVPIGHPRPEPHILFGPSFVLLEHLCFIYSFTPRFHHSIIPINPKGRYLHTYIAHG